MHQLLSQVVREQRFAKMNQMRRGVAGGSRLPHTPTQSLGDAATEMAARSQAIELKRRDEVDAARSRLSDQKFNIGDYDDPLLPRQHAPSKFYPRGVTAEMEAKLLQVVGDLKSGAS